MMNWLKHMQHWWYTLYRVPNAPTKPDMTQRDVDEQRLLQEVWRRIEQVSKAYEQDHRAIPPHK